MKRDTSGIKPIAAEIKDARAETRILLEQVIEQTRQPAAKGSESSPQERYDRALDEVAFKHDMKPAELRAAIDDWSAKVKADPDTRAYDLALADFKDRQYATAATHAATAYSRAMSDREKSTASAIAAARLEGHSHRALAHFDASLAAYRRAAALTDQEQDPLAWANEQAWVANALYETGDYRIAEPLLRDIVKIRETHLSSDSLDLASAIGNLAVFLGETNRLAEAEPLLRRNVGIFLKFRAEHGHQHLHTIAAIRNYRFLCVKLGLSPGEIAAHLEDQRSGAGVEPSVFAEIVREASEAK